MMEYLAKEQKDILSFSVGNKASLTRKIHDSDIQLMASVSGDYNPIHTNAAYAAKTQFKKKIAHGLFCNAIISALLGNNLPGLGTIILSEEVYFTSPVYVGDTITGEVCITSINLESRKIMLSFSCINQHSTEVMHGFAKTKLL